MITYKVFTSGYALMPRKQLDKVREVREAAAAFSSALRPEQIISITENIMDNTLGTVTVTVWYRQDG